MFHVSTEPVLLSEAGLQGLCVSLNTPVLNIDELPVGPARAAIALYAGEYGALELAVGIRSIETRQVAVFQFQGQIPDDKPGPGAMEAATTFAEGMGFLFDDDVVAGGADGRTRAMRLWLDLTELPDVSEEVELDHEVPKLSPAVPLVNEPEELVLESALDSDASDVLEAQQASDEIWLEDASAQEAAEAPAIALTEPADDPSDEAVELEEAIEEPIEEIQPPAVAAREARAEPVAEAASVAAAPVGGEPPRKRVTLTKFRQPPLREKPAARAAAADAAVDAGGESGSAALGRVALVRKRSGGEEAGEAKPGLLLRLLASF